LSVYTSETVMKLPAKTVACAAFLLAATSACAHAQDRVLPPLQYDKPYTGGTFLLRRGLDETDMLQQCPMVPPFGYPRLGLSQPMGLRGLPRLRPDHPGCGTRPGHRASA
jgi:hypothetical protein